MSSINRSIGLVEDDVTWTRARASRRRKRERETQRERQRERERERERRKSVFRRQQSQPAHKPARTRQPPPKH